MTDNNIVPVRGRPTLYDRPLADAICARLAAGESLRAICARADMPHEATVRAWSVEDRDGFSTRYARAREDQAHTIADEILQIADDGSNDWMAANDPKNPGYELNGEHVQRSRLRIDARKWLLARMLPKAYGDKVQAELSGPGGGPIEVGDARNRIMERLARLAGAGAIEADRASVSE